MFPHSLQLKVIFSTQASMFLFTSPRCGIKSIRSSLFSPPSAGCPSERIHKIQLSTFRKPAQREEGWFQIEHVPSLCRNVRLPFLWSRPHPLTTLWPNSPPLAKGSLDDFAEICSLFPMAESDCLIHYPSAYN